MGKIRMYAFYKEIEGVRREGKGREKKKMVNDKAGRQWGTKKVKDLGLKSVIPFH